MEKSSCTLCCLIAPLVLVLCSKHNTTQKYSCVTSYVVMGIIFHPSLSLMFFFKFYSQSVSVFNLHWMYVCDWTQIQFREYNINFEYLLVGKGICFWVFMCSTCSEVPEISSVTRKSLCFAFNIIPSVLTLMLLKRVTNTSN